MIKHKKIISITFIILLIFMTSSLCIAQEGKDVYVIPIEGEINKATYQFVDSMLDQITQDNASAVIFDIDTYGGLISEADKIKELIMKLEIPTIGFVNTKAESAGVLITISNKKVVMAEGATIGSAETIPNTEKVMSLWLNWLRTTAEDRGRDSEIIASMADKDIAIEGVVRKGELLNLNYREAVDLGISDFISNDYGDILSKLDIEYNNIVVFEKDFKTRLAQFVVNPYVATALLAMGFIGLVIEIFTPGFAAGGTISLISFALFFGGNFLAGNSNLSEIILFIVGIILLLIEAAVPGFGVPGIGGIISVVLSIILASGSPQTAILSLVISLTLTIIITIILVKYGARSPYLDKVILSTKQENSKGYISSKISKQYLGEEGMAITTLRPAGTIQIGDERIDAVSEGDFINKGDKVKVVKVQGSRVVVRKLK